MSIKQPPNKYDQALERACDDLERVELTNMLLDLPAVGYLQVDGEDEDWHATTIEIDFVEDYGRGVDETITIMHRQGWQVSSAVFSRGWLRFEERGRDE